MAQYQIRELAHLTGVKAHTIRVWEQRYHLLAPQRTATNIRFYCDEDLRTLLNVALLSEHGYRISRIALMTPDQRSREVESVACLPNNEQSHLLQQLVLATINLDDGLFEQALDTAITADGLETTMLRIVYPFLERIGVLWQTGTVNPAQEHLISNVIRQKVVSAIDALGSCRTSITGQRYVLYLPEGELHELALLFMHYLLRVRGHRVIYLGQNLPTQDLVEVCKLVQPAYIVAVLTVVPERENLLQYVASLARQHPGIGLLLYGAQVQEEGLELPEPARRFRQMTEFIRWLDQAKTA
jgi:MerR family transcriptional regulator, light-induced transcriptional regulator